MSMLVLATKTALDYDGSWTRDLLLLTAQNAKSLGLTEKIILMSDKGSENINDHVRSVSIILKDHIIAQIGINFSYSMVESFFRKLNNCYLYFVNLDSPQQVERQVELFVNQRNNIIPLQALNGATPYVVFTGSWNDQQQIELNNRDKAAMRQRIKENQMLRCNICPN